MPDSRSGIAKVVADAGPLGIPAEPEPLDLFDGDPAAGSPVEGTARALGLGGQIAPHRRGPGRPKGSKNATTADVLRFLGARYRHPLLALADIASMNWRDLAQLLVPEPQVQQVQDGEIAPSIDVALEDGKITREDMWRAAQLQMQAARELSEYMLPKQPRAITITPDSAPLIQMFLGDHQGAGEGAGVIDALRMGFHETPMKTTYDEGVGGEVLDDEVLEDGKPAGNSNA